MRIGELARAADVTPRTIRYYESLGLIPPGEREGGGQHYFPEQTVERLRKIDQLKKLGLSLEEIQGVIDVYFLDGSRVEAKQKVLAILRRHLTETEQKLEDLQEFRTDLQAHIARFESWLERAEKT